MRGAPAGVRRAGPRASPGAVAAALALTAALAPAASGAAQEAGPDLPSLDDVEAALDSGRVARAREALEAWLERNGSREEAGHRARFLRARLMEDADSARLAYTLLAVDGGSVYAARARLRLAQLRLAEGQHRAALEDLELLRADFPGHPLAVESWLWAGRVHRARGDGAAACRAFARAQEVARQAEVPALRERAATARAGCSGGPVAAAGGDAGAGGDADAGGDAGAGSDSDAGFAVQLGAFSRRGAAEELAGQVRDAGVEVRVTGPDPRDGLFRVRGRRFRERSAAEARAARLEERGLSAIVVAVEAAGGGP